MTASASDETRDSRILREKKAMFVMSRFRPLSHKSTLTGSLESVRQCLRLESRAWNSRSTIAMSTTTKRHSLRRRISAFIILASRVSFTSSIFAAAARVRPRLPAEPKGSPSLANATNTWVWRCAISISRLRASIVLSSDKNRIAIRAKKLPNIGRRSGWNGKRVAEVW